MASSTDVAALARRTPAPSRAKELLYTINVMHLYIEVFRDEHQLMYTACKK